MNSPPAATWPKLLARQLAALDADDFDAYGALEPAAEAAAAEASVLQLDAATLQLCADLSAAICWRLRAGRDAVLAELQALPATARSPYAPASSEPHALDIRF